MQESVDLAFKLLNADMSEVVSINLATPSERQLEYLGGVPVQFPTRTGIGKLRTHLQPESDELHELLAARFSEAVMRTFDATELESVIPWLSTGARPSDPWDAYLVGIYLFMGLDPKVRYGIIHRILVAVAQDSGTLLSVREIEILVSNRMGAMLANTVSSVSAVARPQNT